MDAQKYAGTYTMMGFTLAVSEIDGKLGAAVAGAPAGYEIWLEELGDGRFRMRGGPVDGSVAKFVRGEDGAVTALRVGAFELARVAAENAHNLAVVERIPAPRLALTAEKEAAFQRLLEGILAHPDGGEIDYRLAWPRYEFVQFLMGRDLFIFHGSNKRDIDEFAPVRTSVELFDRNGVGNLQAVYGTHDGLWAMFFAVVNRKQLRGSIRNGVMYLHNRGGEALAVYNFSVNQEQLSEQPWCEGALYFLPREAFKRQMMTEESYSNEWACDTAVKPLARLALKPEDFPFLGQIGGHDDGVLLRAETLAKKVHQAALSASLDGGRFTLTLPDSAEIAKTLGELVDIQRGLIPSAQFTLEHRAGGLTLVIDDLPPAYRQTFAESYKELLGK